jgi:hypothetical protein
MLAITTSTICIKGFNKVEQYLPTPGGFATFMPGIGNMPPVKTAMD